MRRTKLRLGVLVVVMIVSMSNTSRAQQPVCAPPVPDQAYLAVCHSSVFAVRRVTRLLSRFSVDQIFKVPPPAFSYTVEDFLTAVIDQQLIAQQLNDEDDLLTFIGDLSAIQFTRLDRSTGTLVANFEEVPRSYRAASNGEEKSSPFSLQLPVLLEGGYWRAPDVLQMAFWKNHRPAFALTLDDAQVVEGDVQCISLSASNLIIDLEEEEQPDVIVSFGGCE